MLKCILLLIASTLSVLAQVGTQGSMFGTVTDATGAVIPAAEIIVTNLDTGLVNKYVTGENGNFEVLALPIGRYSVVFRLPVSRHGT